MKIRKHFIFYGYVQGVGFRFRAVNAARSLGLTGWVRNEWGGSVEMEVQGEKEAIDLLIERLQAGSFIRIERMEEKEIAVQSESGFHAR